MILMLLPDSDYDPTEASVPWHGIVQAGYEVMFATPSGNVAYADKRLTETGFGWLSPFFMTRKKDLAIYDKMIQSPSFKKPLRIDDVNLDKIEGIIVPGGHAQGVRTLLESSAAQSLIVEAFKRDLAVGAICHGVLLLAKAKDPVTQLSVLYDRKTTALPKWMELSAWMCTRGKLGNYYRTYPITVEEEVKSQLHHQRSFVRGPYIPYRDNPGGGKPTCVIRDKNYLSARWPGDCHTFAREFVTLLNERDIPLPRQEVDLAVS